MSVKLIILDTMLEQARNTSEVFQRIRKMLDKMINWAVEGNSIAEYLNKHNGKRMKNAKNVWKFRLSDGERVLYTYGRHVSGIREEDNGSIVLLAYSKHDDQFSSAETCIERLLESRPKLRQIYTLLHDVKDSYPAFIAGVLKQITKYPEDEKEITEFILSGDHSASDIIRFSCLANEKHHVNDGYYLKG